MFKLKSVNLQVYIMLIAIAVIMAFFSVATDGAYLSAKIFLTCYAKLQLLAFLQLEWFCHYFC